MKYIIMSGFCWFLGDWKKPKQLSKINGEVLIARTIRLLRENGAEDIAITSMDDRFANFNASLIKYDSSGDWLDAFYPIEEPVCYIFGDVYFSEKAIQTIVNAPTKDIDFFASAPPFSQDYPKKWAEPFAFKVMDYNGFRNAIGITKRLGAEGKLKRAISWELWQVIKGTELNKIDYTNYTVINDYTSDLDYPSDIDKLEVKLKEVESNRKVSYLIHTYPTRLWYVEKYLIPSMKEQGCENISVYIDKNHIGSLRSHMDSYLELPDDNGGTWHLQDDVIICKDFKRRTEFYNGGIVCGFASQMYDGDKPAGIVDVGNKWFSFPCIRIPNKIAKECARWVLQYIIGNDVYRSFWENGRNEDWAFWSYIRDYYKGLKIQNLAPNLVDHVDYLLGGSANARNRENLCRSKYWEDEDLVEELKGKIDGKCW